VQSRKQSAASITLFDLNEGIRGDTFVVQLLGIRDRLTYWRFFLPCWLLRTTPITYRFFGPQKHVTTKFYCSCHHQSIQKEGEEESTRLVATSVIQQAQITLMSKLHYLDMLWMQLDLLHSRFYKKSTPPQCWTLLCCRLRNKSKANQSNVVWVLICCGHAAVLKLMSYRITSLTRMK